MEITTQFLVLVPVIVGLVEAIKATGFLPSQFAPVTAIVLSVVAVGFLSSFTSAIVIPGLVVGLTASGLYSATRATLNV